MFKKELNDKQYQAILEIKNPLLVLSGAGTGKTRVITYKIAYLVNEQRFFLKNILALTFTNKAASEMRERTLSLLKENSAPIYDYKQINISTFHSACVKILRYHGKLLGYTSEFTIADDNDKNQLLKEIIKNLKLEKLGKLGQVKHFIELFKNDFQTANDIFMKGEIEKEPFFTELSQVYDVYKKKLFSMNMMDFDDLILNVINLFHQEPEIRIYWKNQYRYILVDEFQDTNKVQFLLLKLLMHETANNITMVGDDDQSIYSFRGASIGNILNLDKEFPHLVTIRVEENYRSTPTILTLSNGVIANNKNRLGKNLFTKNKETKKPLLYYAYDDEDEAQFIVGQIKKEIDSYNQLAVIYRTNAQSRLLENELTGQNIPYVVLGGKRFYDRMEIKDLVAYLKVIYNPKDEIALKRIINLPSRGIGTTTLNKIISWANLHGEPFFEALVSIESFYKGLKISQSTKDRILAFVKMMGDFKMIVDTKPFKLLSLIIETIEYKKYLDEEDNSFTRHQNIEELLRFYESFFEDKNLSFRDFIEKIELQDSSDNSKESVKAKVFLTTVHGCKGLEFDVVFIVGLAEEIFPHYLSINTKEELEEERRLFYVAMTRAKKRLIFSYPRDVFLNGQHMHCFESRFLKECNQDLLDILESDGNKNAKAWFSKYI